MGMAAYEIRLLISPFSELFEADFESPVMICVLVLRNVEETLGNMEGSLVDRGGYPSLKLHLKELSIGRVLAKSVLETFNLVLHP